METIRIEKEYREIRARLEDLGLYGKDTQILIRDELGRAVLGSDGKRVPPDMFKGVDADYAVLTSGRYSAEYSRLGRPVIASNDDMAMMFGYMVRCVRKPDGGGPACLIKWRGFRVTGRNIEEVIATCILMEKMCRTELLGPVIGKVRHLPLPLCEIEHQVYLRKYSRRSGDAAVKRSASEDGGSGTSADIPDLALRESVIRYGQLLVENKLIQSTWGNVSARIDMNRFLITPSGVDYYTIRPEEIVEVRIDDGTFEEGLHPSSERKLHQLIYMNRPDISAVIHTHSACCQVFSACREGIYTGTIEYPCAEYAVSGSGKLAENVSGLMLFHDGCLMANHGFVACGHTLQDALLTAMIAEKNASEILHAE